MNSKKLPKGIAQGKGTFHFKSEIKNATTFDLEETITFKKLLKLCRATCAKNNGFFIVNDGKKYAKIIIKDIE